MKTARLFSAQMSCPTRAPLNVVPNAGKRGHTLRSLGIEIPAAYDWAMSFTRASIRDIAREISDSLRHGDDAEARRLAFRFVETYDGAGSDERQRIVADEPAPTGDNRFDSLVAAIVEFSCARHLVPAPAWVEGSTRFLEQWWFISGMPTLHANAIAHSPISFARRGLFITEDALTYA
jgi:hypothetical protein